MVELAYFRAGQVHLRISKDPSHFFIEEKNGDDGIWITLNKYDDEKSARQFMAGAISAFLKWTSLFPTDFLECQECDARILR